jgi:hypothetical protein
MNDLDLPPRRTLPREVRDRIRTKVNTRPPRLGHRAPLTAAAAAAAVVVVVAGIIALHPVLGPAAGPGSGSLRTPTPAGRLALSSPDTRQTSQDLGACGYVAANSPRYRDFPTWEPEPVFTATRRNGNRIVAFVAQDGMPGFCEVEPGRVTVSDPTAAPMRVASASDGQVEINGLYLTRWGVLAGVAKGVTAVECSVVTTERTIRSIPLPVIDDDLFVADVGELVPGDVIELQGRDNAGLALVRGSLVYDPATVRPIGATGKPR